VKFIERKERNASRAICDEISARKGENVSENKNNDKLTNEHKVPSAIDVPRARNFSTFNLLI